MELREGAVIADRFRLIRLLGQGGMGEVWAAQHASLDIPCAVKFIHAESAQKPEVRARFEREAKAAAQLRTNNVVQILDYGIFENTPYIAMEYLEGEPLSARIKRRGRLDPHETFRVVKDIGRALTKAHAAEVVHRDLKPENIFLVMDDDREIAKVLDFGVAKSADKLDSNTQTGALLGTPYYMSPEQAQGTKTVDHRADLWSLAVLTYRCITGELPFKSSALGDLLIKIVTHPLPVPSQVMPGIPEGFDAWWARAAQRDPGQRYQNAKEMVQALSMALNVSMPSTLGNTPMPGGAIGQEIRGAQQQIARTMIADPSELPGQSYGQSGSYGQAPAHGGQGPAGYGAPSATQPSPHAHQPHQAQPHHSQPHQAQPHQAQPHQARAQPHHSQPHHSQPHHSQPHQAQPHQAQPHQAQPHQAQPHLALHPHAAYNPALGDSHATASVAGVPIAARPSSSGGGKLAVVMGVFLIVGVGGVGGFFLFGRSGDPAPVQAAEGGATKTESAAASGTGDTAAEQSAAAPQPSVSAAPSASSAPGASASAPPEPAPPARIVPRPVPVPRPVVVPNPVPVPAPPRPVPDDDAGF